MDTTQLQNHKLELECVEAFKRGDHDEASQLFSCIQQPAAVQTFHVFYLLQSDFTCTNVSLLHLAALHGWMYIVVSLVCEYDCSSQCCDSIGHTPLHYAVHGGSLPVVQYLITEQHCDPLQANDSGNSPFICACRSGHLEIVKYFVKEIGCDPTVANCDGNMPLHIACIHGNLDVVRYLIREGNCDPKSRGCRGFTLLHCACQSDNISLLQYLITELGCDLAARDNKRNLPLHIACWNGKTDLVRYLINEQRCDPKVCGVNGFALLHYACLNGNMLLVKYLITELGSDLALPDSSGNLPIHIACLNGQVDVVKYLLVEQKCNPNVRGSENLTLAHCACQSGNMSLVKYLIEEIGCDLAVPVNEGPSIASVIASSFDPGDIQHNILMRAEQSKDLVSWLDINPQTKIDRDLFGTLSNTSKFLATLFGGPPLLHFACQCGDRAIINYFVKERGFDAESMDSLGNKPIHIACSCGQLDAVKYLITEAKCDPHSRGPLETTPLHCACACGHLGIIQYLITEQGCDLALMNAGGQKPIHIACTSGQLNVVKYLIAEANCDPHSRGLLGHTPLHFACGFGHFGIIQYLITEVGCDPALPDNEGNMPIHVACDTGQLNVIKYLINEHKCDPNVRGIQGFTLLHFASAGGHMDIIQYLIKEQGCEPASKDNKGNMPIHIASDAGQLNVMKYLINEHKCDPSGRNFIDTTPLQHACSKGHKDIIQYLIVEQGCDPTLPNNVGHMPIHFACICSQLNVLKYLIGEIGCNVNSRGERGGTPLHYACAKGNMDIIQYLISEVGCNLQSQDDDGNTPLHIACRAGQFRVFKYLITEQKCDPNSLATTCIRQKLSFLHKMVMDKFCPISENIDYLASWIHRNLQINVDDWLHRLHDLSQLLTTDRDHLKVSTTLLHLACRGGSRDIIQCLVEELGCDAELPDSTGNQPIHYACSYDCLDAVVYLITEAKCSPHSPGCFGATALHLAFQFGNMGIIEYLITELGCDPNSQDNFSNKPIHNACLGGQLDAVKYLIAKHNCNPNSQGFQGMTPLHYACINGHMNIIEYLITELGCDPMLRDNVGNVPMHTACYSGQLNVVKYLHDKHGCSPDIQGQKGITPLHVACDNNHYDIVKYFITELNCNPDIKDEFHQTPLHLVCYYGHIQILRYLLQYANADTLMSVNKFGFTPVNYAEVSDNSYELLKMLQPLLRSKDEYPIHTYTKAVITGNSGAGKTSLAQIVVKQATKPSQILFINEIEVLKKVETLTAGIESQVIRSNEVGNLVLYDLAGQSEYHFSQTVMMETIMRRTPAIFINLVDLSKSDDEISQAIHYWLTFIENATFKTLGTSCIMMVGSHTDLLCEEQIETKATLVEDLVERRVNKLDYLGFVGMNCRKTDTNDTMMFFPLLSKCRESISLCVPPVSVYCHVLYAFLQTKLDEVACQLQDVVSSLAADEKSPIPLEVPLLSKLLEDLSDKGLIIYLKNKQCVEKSWVVMKREAILKDVNGVLFAPKYFRGYHSITSSTGIIRMSSLHEPFPQYDAEMLVELMTCLEFCKPVNLSGITTNLQPLDSISIEYELETDYLLFFPSLLRAERPQSLTSGGDLSCSQQLSFGWCLGCMDYEYQFLTTRFLHVLLLRLAYTFPLLRENYSETHSLHGLERRCTVWTNGIAWNNNNGVRTVVEVIQQSRWVVVSMFRIKDTRPVEYSRNRSAVIRLVLDLQQELAPDLKTLECLISPSLLQQWPLDYLPETDLFAVKDVASCVLLHDLLIISYTDDNYQLPTSEAVFFEPYHLLSPSSVCELMDSCKNDQPVSPALLSEVREWCLQPQLESQSYSSLREHLDKMSIYAGRNPLVVAKLEPDTVISRQSLLSSSAVTTPAQKPVEQLSSACGHSSQAHSKQAPGVTTVDLSDIPDGTLDIDSHLRLLMVVLTDIAYQWEHLGTQLGLKYGKLKDIKKTEIGIQMDCMREMLAAWLQGQGGECSKQALKTALCNIGYSL